MNLFSAAAHALLLHGGSLLGAAFIADYRTKARKGRRVTEKRLLHILRVSRNTEYGKKYGFAEIKSVEDFQNKVPLSSYSDYEPYILRTANNGEQGLITGHKINFFATTSGTVGKVKLVPQIAASYLPYFKAICVFLTCLVRAVRSRGISAVTARGLLTTEVDIRPADSSADGSGRFSIGVISAYAAGGMKHFMPLFAPLPRELFGREPVGDRKYVLARFALQEPDLKWIGGIFMSSLSDIVNYIEANAQLLIRDIETGAIDPSVELSASARASLAKKLRADPGRAAELREIFRNPSDTPLLMRLWKNMSYAGAIGSGDFEPFTNKLRGCCSRDVRFHYGMYAASEAAMGLALDSELSSYLLLMDSVFFEFLPLEEECDLPPERPLLMHELEPGKHYEILITTDAGLYRYRMKDVVKVTGFVGETPTITFAYRVDSLTNTCCCHITGEYLAAAVEAVEKAGQLHIPDYSLYADNDYVPPRLVLYLEPDRRLTEEETERLRTVFEDALQSIASIYRRTREHKGMSPAVLRPMPEGSYARWREARIAAGASSNQLKPLRVIDSPEKLDFFLAAASKEQKQ